MSSTDTLPMQPPWKQRHGFGLGVNYIPFSLHRQEMSSSFRLFTDCQQPHYKLVFPAIFSHLCKGTQHSPSSLRHTSPNQHCGASEESGGILIIIPCIPGEAFIWRFQRIYLFPASHTRHKPYNAIDRLGSCPCSSLASPWGSQHQHHVNQRHLHWKALGSQFFGKPRYFLWVVQFLAIRPKNLDH